MTSQSAQADIQLTALPLLASLSDLARYKPHALIMSDTTTYVSYREERGRGGGGGGGEEVYTIIHEAAIMPS